MAGADSWPGRILWGRLRNRALGAKFRRQHPLGPYYCDFYCHEARLVVELDGHSHCAPGARWRDERRDEWLAQHRLTVIRIFNADVVSRLDHVVARITGALVR